MHHPLINLTDLRSIPRRQHSRAVLASSYDRRGGNHDWSNYLRREGQRAVMMDAEGPGIITRIWTADPQRGIIRIHVDDMALPCIEMPFSALFKALPLSFGIGGESPENYSRSRDEREPMGRTSYCPIPFQHRCKITIEPEDDYLYYQINSSLYPPGASVGSFSLDRIRGDLCVQSSEQAFNRWRSGLPIIDMSTAKPMATTLQPGEASSFFRATGEGCVRGLRIRLGASEALAEDHIRRNLFVLAHFDDDEPKDASIRSPIGPLFLDYGQDPKPRSLLSGKDEEGYYLFYPMPFFHRCELALSNRGILPAKAHVSVLYDEGHIDADNLRFRATWHVETPFGPDHRDYEGLACRLLNLSGIDNVEVLHAFGGGHFVGCGFDMDLSEAPTDRAACEGDEMFFVDDDPRLTMYGTGTEDYLNDAWGIRGYVGPLSGDAVSGEWSKNVRLSGYRLHLTDPVPFTRKGRFTFEHGTGNNCSGRFESVAYWYMDPSLSRTRIEEIRWEDLRTGRSRPNEPAES